MIPHENYHTRGFNKTRKYKLLVKIINIFYGIDFIKLKIRLILNALKRKASFKH